MPARFSRDDVDAIAALASLDLSSDERDLFASQLAHVLEYAEAVQQIDTSGVVPTANVLTRHAADRDDRPRPCLDRDAALANAPDRSSSNEFFRVPRVIG